MKNQKADRSLREISPARIFARPTADDVWLGPTQESALRQLCAPVPLKVLLGPTASGRSCLLRYLASRSHSGVVTLATQGPQERRDNALKSLLASAGLQSSGLARNELRHLLEVFIREQQARGRRVVLLVDEAETIGRSVFQEIVALVESTRQGVPMPELVLGLEHVDQGSSAAAEFVRAAEAPTVVVLSWLNPTEVGWYIHWRMQRFGLGELFSSAATGLIARCTHGCFTAIDHICQMCLLLLRNREAETVDVLLVREAVRTLQRQRRRRHAGTDLETHAELLVSCDGKLLHRGTLGARMLIGRSRLNDLTLESAYLSRHHLALVRGATGYYLSDLNSVNGVLLNGQRVQSAPVGHGDLIEIGPYRIKLNIEGETPESGPGRWADTLAETSVMPTPENPEPAYLKIIK